MSKRTRPRTARAAQHRRARHERRSAQAATIKAWLQMHAPGALIYARPQVCLRKLARVALAVKHLEGNLGRPRFLDEQAGEAFVIPGVYRYAGLMCTSSGRPLLAPRVLYMDGI